MAIRINKAMSILGICSRRDADRFISQGQVKVNNIQVNDFGIKINIGDIITVNDFDYEFIDQPKTKVWIYNKPVGLVTTHKDEKSRDTVFNYVNEIIGRRVISVGRLDLNSEGLLLLTNNGEFSRYAESPSTGWERYYKVRVFGNITQNIISRLNNGISIDNIHYAPISVQLLGKQSSMNQWCICILKEGKNREIRKVFNHFGLQINRLIRIKYGPYELGNLPIGHIKEVREQR